MAAERDNLQGHAFKFGGKTFNFNKDTNLRVQAPETTPSADEIMSDATVDKHLEAANASVGRLKIIHGRIDKIITELKALENRKKK